MRITNNRDTTRSQIFTYDTLNRIASARTQTTTATNCWGEGYTYDIPNSSGAWGNLISISALSAYTGCAQESLNVTVTPQNQVVGDTYDAAGNLITVSGTGGGSYAYNAENQMTTSAGVTYTYDGDGKRVQKSSGTLYWYGMSGDSLVETNLQGNNATEYFFFGGKRIARRGPLGGLFYYVGDHLGTSRVMVQAGQTSPCYNADFYPFGGERIAKGSTGQPINTCPQNYKFTGKERDSESNLDNFGARYDSSNLGRFMSPDAFYKDSHVGDPQSWNEYAYARNNPLRYVDPNGETATVSSNCTTDSQDHTTCNVNISASIAVYSANGANLTQDQLNAAASQIQSSIQNAWSGSFTQDGVTYNVSTQVSVSVAGSQDAAMNSGAQNVIGLSNGNAAPGLDSYVNNRSLFQGGPDTGVFNVNSLSTIAAHEFTHLLGVWDKPGAVLSNTNILNDPTLPHNATASDFGWGIREAVNSVNMGRDMIGSCAEYCGLVPSQPRISSTDTVRAGTAFGRWRFWWK